MVKSIIVLGLGLMTLARSATYYVNFGSGQDTNNGTSETTAWKHAPGDDNAGGTPAGISLQGGDVVLFKGGVIYRGSITIKHSGTAGSPITYKGNGWGPDKAILDGSDPFGTVWTQCASASECKGNSNYAKIFYTTAPTGYGFFTGIFEDGRFLWYSQGPNPSDPFYHDRFREYRTVPISSSTIIQTRTSLTDPTYFTQTDPNYWGGSYIITWRQPNVTSTKAITNYNPATHTITYEDIGGDLYTDRDGYYALLNHPALIDTPGEYSFDKTANRIYLWPLDSDDPTGHSFSSIAWGNGIWYSGRRHLVIEGFVIRHFTTGIRSDNSSTSNIIIRDNELEKMRTGDWYVIQTSGSSITVEKNRLTDCHRAVGIMIGGSNISVLDNFVMRTSRQGIWAMGTTSSLIAGNTVTDCNGTHANGISIYQNCSGIRVERNHVYNCGSVFTLQNSTNITLSYNLFDGGRRANPAADWGGNQNVTFYNNSLIRSGNREGYYLEVGQPAGLTMKNNIIDGLRNVPGTFSHNIYTMYAVGQKPMGTGEIVQFDLKKIFVDPDNSDFHLIAGSPAIDAGTPVGLATDFEGNPVPYGLAPDIGVYEYTPTNITIANLRFSIFDCPAPPNPIGGVALNYLLLGPAQAGSGQGSTIYDGRILNSLGQIVNQNETVKTGIYFIIPDDNHIQQVPFVRR